MLMSIQYFHRQSLSACDHDALIIPGGFGAAKNLCTFGVSSDPTVNEDVARVIREFHAAGKPIGMCCIAPVIAALVLAKEDGKKIKITLGSTGEEFESFIFRITVSKRGPI